MSIELCVVIVVALLCVTKLALSFMQYNGLSYYEMYINKRLREFKEEIKKQCGIL